MSEVRKISVSMPPGVVERVRQAADATGESVSAWLTGAALGMLDEQARLELGRIAADQLVADHEAEHGPIPPEVTDEVEAFLAGPGPVPIVPPSLRHPGLQNPGLQNPGVRNTG